MMLACTCMCVVYAGVGFVRNQPRAPASSDRLFELVSRAVVASRISAGVSLHPQRITGWHEKPVHRMRPWFAPGATCAACGQKGAANMTVGMTWESTQRAVKGTGHNWCGLMKDLWACDGNRYRDTLLKTAPYAPQARLRELPRGTRIYAEGWSYFAQMIIPIICEDATDVWCVYTSGTRVELSKSR